MALLEELKKLDPKERMARLRELEEARKREIEEARKLLTDTEEELAAEAEEHAKIPIDQLRAVDESLLQTGEERELFRVKRFAAAKGKGETEEIAQRRESAAPETAEERHERLERMVARDHRQMPQEELKQYGSPLSAVLDEMQQKYLKPHDVVQEAASITRTVAYSHDMTTEEKWRTYGDMKSLVAKLEQTGAPSKDVQYAVNTLHKFVESMHMQYRT